MLLAVRLDRGVVPVPHPSEDARQGVVAFMASVLEDIFLRPAERHLTGPSLRVTDRIDHFIRVVDLQVGNALEPLNHLALLGQRNAELSLQSVRIARLDNERVALPPTNRVSIPLLDIVRQPFMGLAWLLDTNDADIVIHLHIEHDVVGRLHNLDVVVVHDIGEDCQVKGMGFCWAFESSELVTPPPCARQIPSVLAGRASRGGLTGAVGC
jgi:hypothetical protein